MALSAGALGALAVACLAASLRAVERRRWLARAGSGPKGSRPGPALARGGIVHPLAVLGSGVIGVWLGGVVLGLAAAVVAMVVPVVRRRRRSAARERAAREQLAEGVTVIASGLRSGRSLAQSVALASDELPPPLGPSFRPVVDLVALGQPLQEAIGAWAVEVGGPDARVAAAVFGLHRRTGGELASTLDGLAATLRSRRGAARELRSLTAQARLSATILGLLPIGFFLFLSMVARDDLRSALGTPLGSGTVIVGFTLQALAYAWIRRLLRVEP